MNIQHTRIQAASLALAATFIQTVAKLIVSIATGSIGVLSETIHSGLDLLSSLVTFFVVRVSGRPADWNHPFGHGKIESISALFEAFLLFAAGGYIVFEGISKWVGGAHQIHHVGWGLVVVGASALLNLFVYFQNRSVAQRYESLAIETNAFHFLTDVFSSLAVFISLGLIHLTHWVFLDSIVALCIASYIFWFGIAQMRKCIAELSDTILPQNEMDQVYKILNSHSKEFLNYHDLRTRKAGSIRYIELHLTVCSEQRVRQAHAVCDHIEEDLLKDFKEAQINIHVEPCGNHSPECGEICRFLNQPRHIAHHNA